MVLKLDVPAVTILVEENRILMEFSTNLETRVNFLDSIIALDRLCRRRLCNILIFV